MFHSSPLSDVQSSAPMPSQAHTASPSWVEEFAEALRGGREDADDRWRTWARRLLGGDCLSPALLAQLWAAVVAFDETLAGHLASPVPVPDSTVILSGSGKETFKTFNVSTAAGLLAAASGVNVVKGTSSSVSAVSGSSDVLAVLGLPTLTEPARIPEFVTTYGIAFIDYAVFCPRYAARYDGRFDFLSPMSFVMPTATLAVSADAFLHGLAHDDVETAAQSIHAARPDIARGRVVTTRIGPGQRIDELAPFGCSDSAVLQHGAVRLLRHQDDRLSGPWKRVVRHRDDHASNGAALIESLHPDGNPALTEIVELNAAAVLSTAHSAVGGDEPLHLVREARLDGRAQRLLTRLRFASPKGTR